MNRLSKLLTPGWILSIILALSGLGVALLVPGCSFSGILLILLGCLAAVYQLLSILGKKKPAAAKWLRRLLNLLIVIGLVMSVIAGVFIWKAGCGAPEIDCDYIVVLGAGVNGDRPSLTLQERINAAYGYLCEHPDTLCVVSGGLGHGDSVTEARCMYRELVAMGIDPDRILLDEQATDTRENIANAAELIRQKTAADPEILGIVSSEYHLYRAGLIAREQGITPVGIPAHTHYAHLHINYFLREIAGVWFYNLFGG